MTTADLGKKCRADFKGSKSFVLSAICLAAITWIVVGAISNRDSLMFWLEWEKTALIATGVASVAFWLAAFFWPPQHFQHTGYKTPGTCFCFGLAIVGSLVMIRAGLVATDHYETMAAVCNNLDKGTEFESGTDHQRVMAEELRWQSGLLMVGMFFLCVTESMFLWGTRKCDKDDDDVQRLREDYRNCLKFSEGPCCLVFVIIFVSIGLGAHAASGVLLLTFYKVFVAGAVALQVSLSNIVFVVEFAEGPKRFLASFCSFVLLLCHAPCFVFAAARDKIQQLLKE